MRFPTLLVAVVVVASASGCRLFAEGIACDPDDPATCPDGTTCVDGSCVTGDDPPTPGPPDPICGDGVVNGSEACDFNATPDTCNTDCTAGVCGDAKVDGDEACDDGNAVDTDGCAACALAAAPAVCGDGVENGDEDCDFADDPNGCNTDCTDGECGDGKVDGDEECDDDNNNAADGCDDCVLTGGAPVCGDGVENGTEECDFAIDADVCNSDCTDGECGDGKVDGDEACDDGDQDPNDGCDDCALVPITNQPPPVCGDSVVDLGEDCDFGLDPDTCNTDCTDGVCGDGKIDGDEDCDVVSASCVACRVVVAAFCGDGFKQAAEACDASDVANTADCNTDCTLSTCGDAKVGPDEQCDDGATQNGVVFIGGLDGVSDQSDFEIGTEVSLPSRGWVALNGGTAPRIFDIGNGVLINDATLGLTNYQVQQATTTAVRPNTTYVLHIDMGFVAGGNIGTTATFKAELGTLNAGVFTALGARSGSVTNVGNLATGRNGAGAVSGSTNVVVRTGAVVSGNNLAVRWAQTSNPGPNDFFGIDNVTLAAVGACDAACDVAVGFCGDGVVNAPGEACDGGDDCNDVCLPTTLCPTATVGGFCQIDIPGAVNNRVPRIADFNGDGLPDVVTTESEVQKVNVQLQLGGGVFGAPATFTQTINGRIGEVADVDNDGDIDIVAGGNNDNALQVLFNNGAGVFTTGPSFTTAIDDTRHFNFFDFDDDGDLDIRVGGLNSNGIILLRNNGAGVFAFDQTTLAQNATANAGIVDTTIGDFDGDGDQDAAVANFFVANVAVFVCDGTGDCVFGANLGAAGGPPTIDAIAAGDVDNDGIIDLVAANGGTVETLSLFRGVGDGSFAAAIQIGSQKAGLLSIRDLNGDGRNEIVTVGSDGVVTILTHTGLANFVKTTLSCPGASEVTVGDVNGDGHDDLLCSIPSSNLLRAFLSP